MSIPICTIAVELDGNTLRYRWTIEAESHAVGLTAARGGDAIAMGDDLGTPEGVGAVHAAIDHAAIAIRHRVSGSWNGLHPLF